MQDVLLSQVVYSSNDKGYALMYVHIFRERERERFTIHLYTMYRYNIAYYSVWIPVIWNQALGFLTLLTCMSPLASLLLFISWFLPKYSNSGVAGEGSKADSFINNELMIYLFTHCEPGKFHGRPQYIYKLLYPKLKTGAKKSTKKTRNLKPYWATQAFVPFGHRLEEP